MGCIHIYEFMKINLLILGILIEFKYYNKVKN